MSRLYTSTVKNNKRGEWEEAALNPDLPLGILPFKVILNEQFLFTL